MKVKSGASKGDARDKLPEGSIIYLMDSTYFYHYFFVGVFALIAFVFGPITLILAHFVAPKKPSEIKKSSYECGLESKGDPWIQFRIQYYLFALIFVIFDVEIIFLYPWAVSFQKLGFEAFVAALLFIGILLVGLIYELKKKALEWQ